MIMAVRVATVAGRLDDELRVGFTVQEGLIESETLSQ